MASLRRSTPVVTNSVIYASPESLQIDTETTNPWQSTSGGDSWQSWVFGTSQEWNELLSNQNIIQTSIQVLVQWFTSFIGWLQGEFEGVPETAKTVGTGVQLTQAKDMIAQYIGAQLAGGGSIGKVLSEPNWPQNFGGRIIAHGGALLQLANVEPPSNYWGVRNTPQSGLNRGDPALEYSLGPVPPPANAPYSQSVYVRGFFAPAVMDPASYQLQYGFPPPNPQQFLQFLTDQSAITWRAQLADFSTLEKMRESFFDLWSTAWQQFLTANPVAQPGEPPPPPDSTQCADPCAQEVAEQIYSVALQTSQLYTPIAAIMSTLLQVNRSIQNLSNSGVAVALSSIADSLNSELTAIKVDLDNLGRIADSLQGNDLARIADLLGGFQQSAAMADQLRALITGDGAFNPQAAQTLSGATLGP